MNIALTSDVSSRYEQVGFVDDLEKLESSDIFDDEGFVRKGFGIPMNKLLSGAIRIPLQSSKAIVQEDHVAVGLEYW